MGVFDPLTFTRVSAAWYFNSAGVLTQAASGEPRIDFDPVTLEKLGVLIEGARTNSVANNSNMSAVVAGTPGTVPSQWVVNGTANGITREIVGSFVEDGISYLRVRYYGTASSPYPIQVNPHANNAVTAVAGQVWSGSVFVRKVSGDLPAGTNNARIRWALTDGTNVLTDASTSISTITNAPIRTQRILVSGTVPATAVRAMVGLVLTVPNGATVDFTIDVGAFQLEQSAVVTSPILTTGSAAARSSDRLELLTLSPWYNLTEGTLFVKIRTGILTTSVHWVNINDFSSGNTIQIRNSSGGNANFSVITGGVSQAAANVGAAMSINTIRKLVMAVKENDVAMTTAGLTPVTDTSAILPANLTRLDIGTNHSGAEPCCGHVQEIRYYPKRLTNAQLQALTA